MRFSEGGLDEAIAKAKRAGKLVFVDGWAPWCHTCLSMRQTVLERPELGRYAERFEFVAIDTDRPESAGFVERYPMRVWPTFFVIEPVSASAQELRDAIAEAGYTPVPVEGTARPAAPVIRKGCCCS